MNFAGLKWSELDKVLEVNRIKGQIALIWLIKSKKDYKQLFNQSKSVQNKFDLNFMVKYFQNYSKKTLEMISKANYLCEFLIPNLQTANQQSTKLLKSATDQKDHKIHFIQEQQSETQAHISPGLLLSAFKKIYPNNNSCKIDSHSFVNTHQMTPNGYLSKPAQFQQLIDIVIVQKGHSQGSESVTSRRTYIKISSMMDVNKYEKELKEVKDYDAYIVHFLYVPDQKPSVKWDIFVEKYAFRSLEQQQEPMTKITYSMVFSYTSSSFRSYTFLNFVSSNNATTNFLHAYFDLQKGNEDRLKKLQSYLFHLAQLKSEHRDNQNQQRNEPCYSNELKRELRLPAEHFMEYKKLKDKVLKSYKLLNQKYIDNGDIKDVEMKVQNLVCRFALEHNYDFEKAKRQLAEFMTFEHDLRKNYTLQSFKHWTDKDIIGRIGCDRLGRPVILFKTYNFYADQCQDVGEYMNFLFYYILVDTMNTCKGYVDEVIVLADCSNNTMRNMKIELNRRIIPIGLKYCPRVFFKLMPFKSTAIPYYAYTLVKPLLPPYSSEVIIMVKEGDEKQAYEYCYKYMDVEVIPEVIGGKNTQGRDNTEKSTRDQ